MEKIWNLCLEHPILTTSLTAVAIGTTAVLFGGEQLAMSAIPLDEQSIELPGPERIHVSPLCDYKNGQLFVTEPCYPEAPTCYHSFFHGQKASEDGECLGWRPTSDDPFQWMTYSQVHETALHLGSALLEKGCKADNSTNIGIFSQNRPEWVIMDRACISFSMVAVALYDTLGNEACQHIINITKMSVLFIDKVEKLTILEEILDENTLVRMIVLFEGPVPDETKESFEKRGIELVMYKDLLDIGINNPHEPQPPSKHDIMSICFTSGTTGIPKGAIMTHDNFMTDLNGLKILVQGNGRYMSNEDTHLSYLPLAHQYERLVVHGLMQEGARIGFFQGDIKKLLDDIQALRPTVFPSVPRLLNRIYDKIMSTVNSGSWIKRSLFNFAYKQKKADVNRGIFRTDTFWDKLIFSKIQALLGGRVRWIITGSAPLSTDVLDFLRVAFGCVVSEGYGQTECTACATLTLPSDSSTGHVGPPTASCIIKLVDVPDMNYFAEKNQGEVCFKGPILFKGYLNQPDKTREALDEDGWLHSGDVGEWLPNGVLKLIDRKKHIFKLSQGEYVAPERLESIYTQLSLVAQAFIFGDSLKSSLVGIIVPDEEELIKYASNHSLKGSFHELCQLKEVNQAVLDQVTKHGRKAGLKGFEVVKAIHIHSELFSSENGLLTPTFKNKRSTLKDAFNKEILSLYEQQ